MDKYYLLAWIAYHDGEAQDNTRRAHENTQRAQENTQRAQKHEALANYYIDQLTGGK